MSQLRYRIAGCAALALLALGGTAIAQDVHLFEEAPPLEVLRSIMVPESRPGPGRRLVIGQPDPAPAAMQDPLADSIAPPQPGAALTTAGHARPVPAPAAPSVPGQAGAPGAIGFRINFALNSAVIPPSALPFLDQLGALMREQPQVRLRVEGHTDALGPDAYNLELSARRAVSVAWNLLVHQGIEPSRLVVRGRGEEAPLFENAYDPRNRRVQFARVD